MLSLVKRYHPITGDPFRRDETYWELPPCTALAPYIRCFWGTLHPITDNPAPGTETRQGLVIPDTCMDIIFDIDYTNNTYASAFCTLDEHSYRTGGAEGSPCLTATFAIRFYAWTASLFADWDFHGSKNGCFDPREMFGDLVATLEPRLFSEPTLTGKAAVAEAVLLGQLNGIRPDCDLLNAVHFLLQSEGRARIGEVTEYAAISPRRMERLFQQHMGISPKSFASLVRYQLLWQEIASVPRFSVLDAVDRFGYTDQAHLLNDFRRRHLMTPAQALRFAGIGPGGGLPE